MTHDEQNLNVGTEQKLDSNTLLPHIYPVWVNLLALAIIAIFIYSIFQLPQLLKGASLLHAAQTAYKNDHYVLARRNYLLLLKEFPESHAAHLGLAEAVFADKNYGSYSIGLEHLAKMQLSKDEWTRIAKVMPAELQALFVDVKG